MGIHVCFDIYVNQYTDVYLFYLCCGFQLIWTFNEWFTKPLDINQSKSSTCAMVFLIYQAIDVNTHYLCCEYQLTWTLNEWFIGGLILANQIWAHVHARVGSHFWVYQCINVHIIYLCCEYQLIWTYNKWFMGAFVSTNQIQAHVHARAGMRFRCINQ